MSDTTNQTNNTGHRCINGISYLHECRECEASISDADVQAFAKCMEQESAMSPTTGIASSHADPSIHGLMQVRWHLEMFAYEPPVLVCQLPIVGAEAILAALDAGRIPGYGNVATLITITAERDALKAELDNAFALSHVIHQANAEAAQQGRGVQ